MPKKKLKRRIPRLPFLLTIVRGHIGKEYVIKHYSYGAIKTRYPRMEHIVASQAQRKQRNLFAEAVAFAKEIRTNPSLAPKDLRVKKKGPFTLYHAAIQYYMLREKKEKQRREEEGHRILSMALYKQLKEDERKKRQEQIHGMGVQTASFPICQKPVSCDLPLTKPHLSVPIRAQLYLSVPDRPYSFIVCHNRALFYLIVPNRTQGGNDTGPPVHLAHEIIFNQKNIP